jgi:hypothetical protein
MSLMLNMWLHFTRVMLNNIIFWINTTCTKQVHIMVNTLDFYLGGAQFESQMVQWLSWLMGAAIFQWFQTNAETVSL